MAASVTSETSAFLPAKSASSSMHSMVISVESMSKQIRPKSESFLPGWVKAQSSFSASISGISASNSALRSAFFRQTTCGGRGSTALAPVAATMRSSRKVGRAPPWMMRFMRRQSGEAFRQYVAQHDGGVAQPFLGGVPADAAVGDRAAVLQLRQVGRNRLVARLDVGFDHDANDELIARANRVHDVGHHQRRQFRFPGTVGVRAVDDDVGRQLGLGDGSFGDGDGNGVVVRAGVTAAQYD